MSDWNRCFVTGIFPTSSPGADALRFPLFLSGMLMLRSFSCVLMLVLVLPFAGCIRQSPESLLEEQRLRTAIQIHPEHEMGYLRLAQFLENRRRYSETLYVLKQGQQKVPGSVLMVRLEGSLYQNQGDDEQVEAFYQNTIKKHPKETAFLLDRARWNWTKARPEKALQDLEALFVHDPENFEAHYLAGLIRISIGQEEKALENLIQAGSLQDGHAEIWSHIANLWNHLGETEKALAAIRKALEHAPESYPYLQQYVNYLETRLDTHQSETIDDLRMALRQLMWLESNDSWVLAHSGYLSWQEGNLEEAETQLIRALELQPDYSWAHFRLGSVYMARKEWQSAIQSFETGLDLQPNHPWALQQLAFGFEMKGETRKAILRYEALLEQNPENLPMLLRLVNLYWQEFQFDQIEKTLVKGQKQLPDNMELANILLKYRQSRGQLEEALSLLTSIEKKHSNGAILFRLGQLEQQRGQADQARAWFQKTLEVDPGNLDAQIRLIQLDLKQKDLEPAEEQLKRLLQSKPDLEWALAQSARLKLKEQKLPECRELLEKGLRLHPGSVSLLKLQGLLLEEEQKWEEALHAFLKIDSLQVDNSLIQTHLGMIRHLLGKHDGAQKHLEEALLTTGNNLWAFLLRVQYRHEHTQTLWWGNEWKAMEPILDDLLHRRFDQGWEKIKAARLDPLSRNALKNLYFLLQDSGDQLMLDPEGVASREVSPGIRYLWGHLHDRLGNAEKALAHYLSVLEEVPNDPWIHLRAGILQEQKGALFKASQHYQTALDAYPDSFRILFRMSIVSMNLMKEEEAIRIHQKMIELRPEHALSLNNLAWLYLTAQDSRLRNTEKALELALKSVELEATIDHMDTLAEAYFQSGQAAKAIETLRKGARQATYPKSRERYLKGQYLRFRKGDPSASPPPVS